MNSDTSRLSQLQSEIQQHSPYPERVVILGACKAQTVDRVKELVAAGLKLLGNNYVQEGAALRGAMAGVEMKWHFIGHIQSRKARELLDYDCIQSLDRLSIAEELNKRLAGRGKKLSVLVEINLGSEESKSGIVPGTLPQFLDAVKAFENLQVDGLMGMPPPLLPVENRRRYFAQLRDLFAPHANEWKWLSMGTSEDYLVALQEGATVIRLGTSLFGKRPVLLKFA